MKKLALALVCLVSVAFFASCDPTITNPEPTIAILSDEGCLVGGEVIDMNVVYSYGFIATSNTQTLKELSKFVVVCGSTTLCDTAISGTVFNYKGEIYFTNEDSRDITPAEIVATVTDVAGNTATATIKFDINEEIALVATPFEWRRDGGAAGTGLAEFGLQWTSNTSNNAIIKPLDDATLYRFESSVWDNTNTEVEKAALFGEQLIGIAQFNDVSVTAQSQEYDIVLGTTYNGVNHLIHVTGSTANERSWHFTITGEAK